PAEPVARATDSDVTGQAPATHVPEQDVGGRAIADGDYRLELASAALPVGVPATLGLRIVDGRGIPVTAFTEVHEKPMHVFLVRRDLSHYHHLHATMGGDGT